MLSLVHPAVHQKLQAAFIRQRKDFDPMMIQILPQLLRSRIAKAKDPNISVLFLIIYPQLPVYRKRRIAAAGASGALELPAAGNPQKNPLSGIQAFIPRKNLFHGPLIIHHIDPLRRPTHCEVLRHRIKLLLSFLHAGHIILKLDIRQLSGQLPQLHKRRARAFHRQVSPCQLGKAVF